ncbi:MAG: MFS transporter, partial [Candidatus Sumerlaeota bacterium]
MPTYSTPEQKLGRSFWALTISQFLGAMNDNAFRWVVALGLVAKFSYEFDADGNLINNFGPVTITGALMAIPYILFSAAAGVVADRLGKRRMIVWMNATEAFLMVLGMLAFMADSALMAYLVLFLMLTQSAFFSPAKYGIIPELVPRERLSFANGIIGATTYLSIILGTIGGTALFAIFGPAENQPRAPLTPHWQAAILFVVVAIVGFLVSLMVRDTGVRSGQKEANVWFWQDIARNLRSVRGRRYLHLSLYAVGFFLFLGAFTQLNVAPFGINILDLP